MKEEISVVEQSHTIPPLAPSRVRRVSWGAIFAGLFVTLAVQLMLTLLGTAIGAGSFDPLQEQNPGRGLGLGAAIWLGVTGLISVWVGACVAGRLSGGPTRSDGMLHGIVTWSASTLAMVLLLATGVSAILGGTASLVSRGMAENNSQRGGQNGGTGSISEQVKNLFPQAGALLPPTGRTEGRQVPGQLTGLAQQDSELAAALARMEKNGGASKATQDRDQVVNLLTTKHNMDQAQAQSLVNQWDQQYQQVQTQTEQKAREVGDKAARGVSQGALIGFGALLLGLLAAAWGGWAGTASLPRPLEPATVVTTQP